MSTTMFKVLYKNIIYPRLQFCTGLIFTAQHAKSQEERGFNIILPSILTKKFILCHSNCKKHVLFFSVSKYFEQDCNYDKKKLV